MGYISLNKNNFFNNLDFYSKVCTKDKVAIALKDNAYGHGTLEVAKMCSEYGIKHVFVRDMREVEIIRDFDFESILVLYDIPKEYNENIIVSVNSISHLKQIPDNSKIELKVDSGMNRNGIIDDEFEEVYAIIKEKNFKVYGVFTHFCCADEDNDITFIQEQKFLKQVEFFKKNIDYKFRIHCANSAGALKVDMSKYDLARIGIGSYGYLDLEEDKYLKPVLHLYANKIATKHIKKGDHVGYGSKAFIAPHDMTVSNYDMGYGNGFLRLSEDKKSTIADGREILGRISMDSFAIEGDDEMVCAFDDAKQLAKAHSTITYEITTTLSPFIKRVIE